MVERPNDAAVLVVELRDWLPPGNVFTEPWHDETHRMCIQAADTITRLLVALEPFARWADTLDDMPDHDVRYATLHVPSGAQISITAADLRRARDVLQPPAGEGEGEGL